MKVKNKQGIKNVQLSGAKGRTGDFGNMRFRELIATGEKELIDQTPKMQG